MAKRKKRAKVSGIRRRRSGVSGTGSYQNALMMVVGAIGGGVAARMAAASFGKNLQPTIVAGAQVAAGCYLAVSQNHPVAVGAGLGIAGEGATHFLQKTGVIKGVDDDSYLGYLEEGGELSGVDYSTLPEISGDLDEEY